MHRTASSISTNLAALSLATALYAPAHAAEVVHSFTSGGEAEAIGVFADEYKARGGSWTDNPVTGADTARQISVNKIAGGKPPKAQLDVQ